MKKLFVSILLMAFLFTAVAMPAMAVYYPAYECDYCDAVGVRKTCAGSCAEDYTGPVTTCTLRSNCTYSNILYFTTYSCNGSCRSNVYTPHFEYATHTNPLCGQIGSCRVDTV